MKTRKLVFLSFLALVIIQTGCESDNKDHSSDQKEKHNSKLFEALDTDQTGIDFVNEVKEDQDYHYFNYPYLYNGGGVAVGDLNNDGLADLYFSGNRVRDELYLNSGNLAFKKITASAGMLDQQDSWHTGVSMWDANADGFLDIYVCRSGKNDSPDSRKNLLYINQGNLTFVEAASSFGLDDSGYSTQAYPFDFDRDGDLDLYVVNHRIDFINNARYDFEDDKKIDPNSSDHLFRNNGNQTFTEISKAAGIQNKAWGLSAAIDDYNNDGWDDIYVANDFHQPDYLYLNQQDGTFKESLADYFKHTSFYSMGSDMADINNDGLCDLIVLDMVSESHLRSKKMMAAMSTDNFWLLVNNGYHYQYMNNALQLNQGNGPFNEIGQLAGISKTDWSWAPLLADFDNDGWKDLFVTNGIKKDVTDNDFRIRMEQQLKEKGGVHWKDATEMLPSSSVPNYIFQNNRQLKFENQTVAWGFSKPVNSNGAAYGDFDNDGDLDLVLNNMDTPATLYRNNKVADHSGNYLSLELSGPKENPFGVGTKLNLYQTGSQQFQRLFPSRGFQSAVGYNIHFGLGDGNNIDSLVVTWPDGHRQKLENISPKQHLKIVYDPKTKVQSLPLMQADKMLFKELSSNNSLNFTHQENNFNDFKLEVLLPHKQSEFGPMISVGDVNKDGLEDCFIGGAHKQSGKLFLQKTDGTFEPSATQPWDFDRESEDLESLFFDADQDGDLDLYVVSGGAVFTQGHPALQDRLYLNNGSGVFKKAINALPTMTVSGLSVCAGDMDGDGDLDLFVGGRLIPGNYPLPPRSYLLENKNGVFTDVTDILAPGLMNPGLVHDAIFTDFDGDQDLDIMVVGEWMPILVFENEEGFFLDATSKIIDIETRGWWSRIVETDLDLDGKPDYIVGNIGENNKFQPSDDRPLHIYANDFDHNKTLDIYLAKEKNAVILPVRGRECSSQQLPDIPKKFPTYSAFGEAQVEDILGASEMQEAYHLKATMMSSGFLMNNGGKLTFKKLPVEGQFSQINGIITEDFNNDTYPDLLIAGNNFGAEVETVRYDASGGILFFNNRQGGFRPVPTIQSGFLADGNVKDLNILHLKNSKDKIVVLVSNNDEKLQVFECFR